MRRLAAAVALGAAWLSAAAAGAGERPEIHYMLQCQGCHLEDGSGKPGSVPDFRDRIALFLSIPGGREYLIRVPGSAQSPLDDGELAAVLTWLVRRFGPAGVAAASPPFSAQEVARHRASPLIEVEQTRRALLAQIAARAGGAPRDLP